MSLRDNYEGANIPISVPSRSREISVCNKGPKLDNLNSIISLGKIDIVRLNEVL